MNREITYCDCANYNNHETCTLLDRLGHVISGTESLATKEKEANKLCNTCSSFKDLYSTYRR